jgi:hypothetical protein
MNPEEPSDLNPAPPEEPIVNTEREDDSAGEDDNFIDVYLNIEVEPAQDKPLTQRYIPIDYVCQASVYSTFREVLHELMPVDKLISAYDFMYEWNIIDNLDKELHEIFGHSTPVVIISANIIRTVLVRSSIVGNDADIREFTASLAMPISKIYEHMYGSPVDTGILAQGPGTARPQQGWTGSALNVTRNLHPPSLEFNANGTTDTGSSLNANPLGVGLKLSVTSPAFNLQFVYKDIMLDPSKTLSHYGIKTDVKLTLIPNLVTGASIKRSASNLLNYNTGPARKSARTDGDATVDHSKHACSCTGSAYGSICLRSIPSFSSIPYVRLEQVELDEQEHNNLPSATFLKSLLARHGLVCMIVIESKGIYLLNQVQQDYIVQKINKRAIILFQQDKTKSTDIIEGRKTLNKMVNALLHRYNINYSKTQPATNSLSTDREVVSYASISSTKVADLLIKLKQAKTDRHNTLARANIKSGNNPL